VSSAKPPSQRVAKDKQVVLHFSVSLEAGSVVDTTRGKDPASLIIGDGQLLPGFEKLLMNLKAGDKRSALVPMKDAFGAHRDENVQKIKRRSFAPDIELEKGLVVSFADQAGAELPGMVEDYDEDYVTVDFNHPLAGKDLFFEVEIISVDEPPQPVNIMGSK